MDTRPYVIEQGDYLLKLATRYGFDADAVWNHPSNAHLKKQGRAPHILHPGDVLYIPDAKRTWLPAHVGSETSFSVKLIYTKVSVSFASVGKPLANAECIVHGIPAPNKFTTDGDGKLELKVPVGVSVITVDFPKHSLVQRLHIGGMDPKTERSGMWERLRNLGHVPQDAPAASEVPDEDFSEAVRAFQNTHKLTVTGDLDDATLDKIESVHGC